MSNLERTVSESVDVLLGLGSNRDRARYLTFGIEALREAYGTVRTSPVYESAAVGFAGSPFYNMVAAVRTTEPLAAVNARLKHIEDLCGRDRTQPKYSSRNLDIDILTYGQLSGRVEGIELPRPEVFYHAFVLKPLVDLCPDGVIPGDTRTWGALWQSDSRPDQVVSRVDLTF